MKAETRIPNRGSLFGVAKVSINRQAGRPCENDAESRRPDTPSCMSILKLNVVIYSFLVATTFMEKHYPTLGRPEGRLLMGYSKSGSGSFKMILEHSDFFGYAASWDGNMYGHHFLKIVQQTPEKLAPFKEKNRLVLADGEKNYWRTANVAYHDLLKKENILHVYDDSQAVGHAWNVKWMAPTLRAMMKLCEENGTDMREQE